MVSEFQIADELEEIGNDPEEEIDHFGSTAHPNDRAGLDPKVRSNLRELACNG